MLIKYLWKKFITKQFKYFFNSNFDNPFEQLRSDMAEGYLSQAEEALISQIEAEYREMEVKLAKREKQNKLAEHYNYKYPPKPIFYSGRVLYGSRRRFPLDVRDFFNLNDEILKRVVKDVCKGLESDNDKAVELLKWVIKNIKYVSDKKQFNLPELWLMPYETLKTKKGDCDDGAILLANLLLVSGISSWKVRVTAGKVYDPISKRLVGHLFVTYFDETTEGWVLLDWCYYPTLKAIKDRKEYKNEEMYRTCWFSFNDKNSWAEGVKDIKKMKGVK